MFLIVGLGNPGKKFNFTRHNIGFEILEKLKLSLKNFFDWKKNKKLLSQISENEIFGKKIILAKPQTFMNNSGKAVNLLIKNYKIKTENLWVVHDDLDLPLGKIKISKNRGSAGHKGIESIIQEIKSKNFVRFRIGIKPSFSVFPSFQKEKIKQNVENFVLQKFDKEEEKIIKKIIKKTIEAIEFAIKEGLEKSMNIYNR